MDRRNFLKLGIATSSSFIFPEILSASAYDKFKLTPEYFPDLNIKNHEYFTFLVSDLYDTTKKIAFGENILTPCASLIKPYGCYAYLEGSTNIGSDFDFGYGVGKRSINMLTDILTMSKNSQFNEFIKVASQLKNTDSQEKYEKGIENLNQVLNLKIPKLENNLIFEKEIPIGGAEYENQSNQIANFELMKHLYEQDTLSKRLVYNNLKTWTTRVDTLSLIPKKDLKDLRLKTGTTNRSYGTFGIIESKNKNPIFVGINIVSPNALPSIGLDSKQWYKRANKISSVLSHRIFDAYKNSF